MPNTTNAFMGSAPHRAEDNRRFEGLARARKAGEHFRRDFADSDYWDQLAAARGIRLPQWHVAPTRGKMLVWLKKLGLTTEWHQGWSGLETLGEWPKRNPDWPLRSFVGHLLEETSVRVDPEKTATH